MRLANELGVARVDELLAMIEPRELDERIAYYRLEEFENGKQYTLH